MVTRFCFFLPPAVGLVAGLVPHALVCRISARRAEAFAERIEEAKNNGTYDSPEPSPREEFGSRPPTRDLLYGEDRGFDFEEFALSRPNTAEQPQIAGGIMDILGTFVEEDPSTNSILKKLDSDSESDMSGAAGREAVLGGRKIRFRRRTYLPVSTDWQIGQDGLASLHL